jgi:chemotaxis protein methyltransferase CheR
MTGRAMAVREISDQDLTVWQELVAHRCGHTFFGERVHILRNAITSRMRALGISTSGAYYKQVTSHPDGLTEWHELLELLLNKETSFFRDFGVYQALTTLALPNLLRLRQLDGADRIYLWSAGCSTGQEAYSLAMACLEVPGMPCHAVRILGSDLSLRALEQARRNCYKAAAMRCLPPDCQSKYLEVQRDQAKTVYRVREKVQQLVEFKQFNLIEPSTYPAFPQDGIFCLNVLIYFSPVRRAQIIANLCTWLRPGGYLFVGPGDAIGISLPDIETILLPDAQIFRRRV